MFVCEHCKKVSAPGEKMVRVPVKTKAVEHPMVERHGKIRNGGRGTQIVEEKRVHVSCASELGMKLREAELT